VGDDFDVGGGYVRVLFDEMGSKVAGEELGRCYWVLFGFDVDGILHRVGGDDYTVVRLGISGYWLGGVII